MTSDMRPANEEPLPTDQDSLEKIVQERTRELTRSNAYIKSIISTIPSALIVVNDRYEIETANGKFFSLFQIPVGNIIGRPFCEVIDCCKNAPNPCVIKERLARVFRNREAFTAIDNVFCQQKGKRYNLSVRISVLEGAGEKALMVFEDITQKLIFENQLLQNERLAATGRLAASIAHEINNPLQGIITHLEIIRDQLPEHLKEDESFTIVHDSIIKIKNIVRQLLDIYRSADTKKETIDINMLIERVVRLVYNQVRLKRAEVQVRLATDLPVFSGWPQQIHQVILNILLNALDAINERDIITIRSYRSADDIIIKIKDTGKGIAPENIDHIFDPFFSTKQDSGVGLGLFVCQGLIKNHNGVLSVSSEYGKGTEFTILLPGLL
jgi:signal transduction histidine kinase